MLSRRRASRSQACSIYHNLLASGQDLEQLCTQESVSKCEKQGLRPTRFSADTIAYGQGLDISPSRVQGFFDGMETFGGCPSAFKFPRTRRPFAQGRRFRPAKCQRSLISQALVGSAVIFGNMVTSLSVCEALFRADGHTKGG
jgi:hypothetical protein